MGVAAAGVGGGSEPRFFYTGGVLVNPRFGGPLRGLIWAGHLTCGLYGSKHRPNNTSQPNSTCAYPFKLPGSLSEA